ncbi:MULTISPECIES: FMN-dependent NADH-azoreductase [unclassified Variovorax]|uniref:FMN-dependent NADH-azoreductase n=1 Tax=unclassified Variovorax TaxID=663243 RepID=UPI0016022997|nr:MULTISPECIES: NAD(P)H-dependent oxidoreductase [unclassified Variovorax]MBB1604853.1 FMN-dependent NADH-azoreductase [Variovorax sp. UMC13]MDM0089115.1 NAD(P)H-dependent oxidoreductase [Variovorax sp. J22G40]MDM0147188.1 NAD(P)H-dependent oxidoreductase [Variovorax sp. J2P1-31]
MKLLQVDASVLGTNSVSRQLTADIVAEWRRAHPDTTVDYLDLAVDTPNHFDANALGIKVGVQAEPTEAQKRENAVSEKLVSQFLAADVIVVGAPLYNFSIPTQLKAWIDRLAQAGRTFKYTEKGPVGLAGGKTVIVASSRGGIYSTSEGGQAAEHQESYLKVVFGFFGITDVRIVRAEGLAMGDAPKAAAIESARADIRTATAEAANQAVSQLAA